MNALVISQAKKLGFSCQLNKVGLWEISPANYHERWKIIQSEERWVLSIGNVPQIYLNFLEIEMFLKRRSSCLNEKKFPRQ